MQKLCWSEAAELLANISDQDDTTRLLTNLARNFAALEKNRPVLYRALVVCGGNSPYSLAVTPKGDYVVVRNEENGKQALCSFHYQTSALKQKYTSEFEITSPICLAGIGDGNALTLISGLDSIKPQDQQHAIYVIEPDLRILWIALRLQDFTQENGPIVNQRYYWFTGSEWAGTLKQFLIDEEMLPSPKTIELIGMRGEEVITVFHEAATYHSQEEQRLKTELKSYYGSISPDSFANLFSGTPQRTPRLLAITPRLSTVIQYSAKDTLRAFKDMGFATRLFIEPTDAHRFTSISLVRKLSEFKPDAVLIINHLRYEYQDIFPPQLPFICWIQDHLHSLGNNNAGKSIGLRDFVLTGIKPVYTSSYSYPKRQCIDMPKLTRNPARPEKWSCSGDDLVYVSNASCIAEKYIEDALAHAVNKPDLKEYIQLCCEKMLDVYNNGDSLPTMWHVRSLVENICSETGFIFPDPEWKVQLIRLLNHPLNDSLYRHQTLKWVASIADRLGLRLSLYGNGWEKHPDFAKYARGPVAYGKELEELTRNSKINLQIIPSLCLHQRLLDGLVAGGFYLVRDHPGNRILPEAAAFLNANFDAEVSSTEDALKAANSNVHKKLEDLIFRSTCLIKKIDSIDLVEWVRCCQRTGLLNTSGSILPFYNEIAFSDEKTLTATILNYIDKENTRQEIATAQRQSVEQRLSYTAGFNRVMKSITGLLHEEAGLA